MDKIDDQKAKTIPIKLAIGKFNNKEMLVGLIRAVIVITLILFFILVVIYAGISFYGVPPSSIQCFIKIIGSIIIVMLLFGYSTLIDYTDERK